MDQRNYGLEGQVAAQELLLGHPDQAVGQRVDLHFAVRERVMFVGPVVHGVAPVVEAGRRHDRSLDAFDAGAVMTASGGSERKQQGDCCGYEILVVG
ncbi:hypothetical protein D3C78_1661940 [compost metagenome]